MTDDARHLSRYANRAGRDHLGRARCTIGKGPIIALTGEAGRILCEDVRASSRRPTDPGGACERPRKRHSRAGRQTMQPAQLKALIIAALVVVPISAADNLAPSCRNSSLATGARSRRATPRPTRTTRTSTRAASAATTKRNRIVSKSNRASLAAVRYNVPIPLCPKSSIDGRSRFNAPRLTPSTSNCGWLVNDFT